MEQRTLAQARESWRIEDPTWTKVRNVIVFVMLASWLASAAGYFTDPKRFFASYLTGFVDVTVIPLGCLFFVMVMFLTGSAWSVTMRRIFETVMFAIPIGALLFIPVVLGIHELYEWSHADHVAHDKILQGKAAWLNATGFTIRGFVYFAIWSFLAWRIYANSTKQDRTRSAAEMHATSALSAPGLLLTFLATSFAAFDWVMSLNPHWYSTIFGIYIYAGGGLGCMCTVMLICQWFRKNGILKESIHLEHYHDLGKWMFALTVFWTYIAFSQYLLIWYANLAEETIFYQQRLTGNWKWMSLALLLGHFIIPFFVLLPRAAKRNLNVLFFAAIWILTFCYIDIFWLVMPNFYPDGFTFHWLDLSCLAAVSSTYGFAFWMRLRQHSLVPEGDLRLEQSLAHVNV
jgi:hypothetical protein